MKKFIFFLQAFSLLATALSYGQAKLAPDSTKVGGMKALPAVQWYRSNRDGKAVYYMYDASINKTYPFYTAQYANYVFLSKADAAALYQPAGASTPGSLQLSLTTNGVNGPSVLSGNVLNIPTVTLAGIGAHPLENQRLSTTSSPVFNNLNINGNIGIGTNIPDEKLTVYGKVHAQAIKVDLKVPLGDYVFKPDYKLSSLNEVKTYVARNHHLKDVPSAAQVAKDGMDVGDMNRRLLLKVEELTLYVIQKDKQLNIQGAKLAKIEKLLTAHERVYKHLNFNAKSELL